MADKDSNAIHFWDFKSNSSRDIKRKYNEEIPIVFKPRIRRLFSF